MITSNQKLKEAYVWIWLPKATTPVVAGKLNLHDRHYSFNYGKSYLERDNAIALYDRELPLQRGVLEPEFGLIMPNCIRDASPDAWGRRVILNRHYGRKSTQLDTTELNELYYLLESGSDRIGALDFQYSGTEYIPRSSVNVCLDELLESAARVEQGVPLTQELDQALFHGSSIGGARPKAFIEYNQKKFIAKFSSSSDLYSVLKLEFIAMRLARLAGLNVASVELVQAAHKDVLLIERFDRTSSNKGWHRHAMLSALTLLGLDEMMARYASYEKLAEIIRYRFEKPKEALKELFSRLVFNILSSNTDDHARNHAAFWDGKCLSLTPAYDVCPQNGTGFTASQAMIIADQDRRSQLSSCLLAAHHFLLSEEEARIIIQHQVDMIKTHWDEVCLLANLSEIEKDFFWGKQFFNPYAFLGFF
ncbi:MAG: type II toxin-antitoxin system HipA family toxin [Legionellaceae bacterium]|jgi:serine/threonine-protein kinase HipA|nr:type II toxin-antitoxin system HipA family toxin [Legionellaceae bacterium]